MATRNMDIDKDMDKIGHDWLCELNRTYIHICTEYGVHTYKSRKSCN